MLLVVGSRALHHHGLIEYRDVKNSDWDFIASPGEWLHFKNRMNGTVVEVQSPNVQAFKCMHNGRETYFEAYIFEYDDESSSELLAHYAVFNGCYDALSQMYWATPEMCLAIKLSHRFKKNTRFFQKTMHHIRFLRNKGIVLDNKLQKISELRQKETLAYSHPNLDVDKDSFFKDDFYIYDHDSIHEAVALAGRPAYTFYMKDGSEVMTSKEKFDSLPEEIKLAGVYEETCVLALERHQIPNNFNPDPTGSFMYALEKVCTSITSGWFREYAWENYHKIVAMHKKLGKTDYVKRFKQNFDMIRPFK
jgi:hypothetical protein